MSSKKLRPHPFDEGSIKEIWNLFFDPLVNYKPTQVPVEEWMESLWDIRNRDITSYVARHDFRLPGLFCSAPLVRVQGLGKRMVREGARIWVRLDALNPGWVELETIEPVSQVFVLSTSEWNSIAANLEEQRGE